MQSVQDNRIAEKREKEESFFKAFSKNSPADDEEKDPERVFTICLWDCNVKVYKLYSVVKNYLTDNYSVDSAILLALIADAKLPIEETLQTIPYIHSGYISTITPKAKENGD